MYAALMLLDLGIDCEILEADNRVGGRLFTHRFSDSKERGSAAWYDYIDMGAMRYPDIPTMSRVIGNKKWSLINYLNVSLKELKAAPEYEVKLLPYYLTDPKKNNFVFYNHRKVFADQSLDRDPLFFSDSKNQGVGSAVPDEYANISPDTWIDQAYVPFKNAMKAPNNFNDGFQKLMSYDHLSTRAMMHTTNQYPERVIGWLETVDSASGLYDESFTESVMDSFDFEGSTWYCVDGGSEKITQAMEFVLNKKGCKILKNRNVREIQPSKDKISLQSISVDDKGKITNKNSSEYDHVIVTAPLSVIRTMNLTECNLSYQKRYALRTIHYDHSVKVALKFSRRFWQDSKTMQGKEFVGGKIGTDRPVRTVVFPSYGIDLPDGTGVMIASYTWAQDASRMGSQSKENAIEMCLRDLEIIFADEFPKTGKESLRSLYIEDSGFVVDWNKQPYSLGAFALFGPGQFSSSYRGLVQPEVNGQLHFAGEATSVHHAWVLGSLNSAYRTVLEILQKEQLFDKIELLKSNWGTIDEVETNPNPPNQPTALKNMVVNGNVKNHTNNNVVVKNNQSVKASSPQPGTPSALGLKTFRV